MTASTISWHHNFQISTVVSNFNGYSYDTLNRYRFPYGFLKLTYQNAVGTSLTDYISWLSSCRLRFSNEISKLTCPNANDASLINCTRWRILKQEALLLWTFQADLSDCLWLSFYGFSKRTCFYARVQW